MFPQGQEITRSCKGKGQRVLGGHPVGVGSQPALPTLCHSHVTSCKRGEQTWCWMAQMQRAQVMPERCSSSKGIIFQTTINIGSFMINGFGVLAAKIQPPLRYLQFPPQYLNFCTSQELEKAFFLPQESRLGTECTTSKVRFTLDWGIRKEGKFFNQTFLFRRECTGFSAGRDGLGAETELIFHSVIPCL